MAIRVPCPSHLQLQLRLPWNACVFNGQEKTLQRLFREQEIMEQS